MPRILKHLLYFTKSLKHDNIYIFCLWMPEEQKKLTSISEHVLYMRYRIYGKFKLLIYFTKSLKREIFFINVGD